MTQEQEIEKIELDTTIHEFKTPREKNDYADKVLEDFAKEYSDIDNAINIIQKEESKNTAYNQTQQSEAQTQQEEENGNNREANELDRAINSITQSRGLVDILKAFYSMEKALYELKLSAKKPNAEATKEEIIHAKDKPLTIDFVKQSLKRLKNAKEQIQDYAKNLALQRAFAKELGKDIAMHQMVDSAESKSAYVRRIDEKLIQVREKFPYFENNFPKMLKTATEITKPTIKERDNNTNRVARLSL